MTFFFYIDVFFIWSYKIPLLFNIFLLLNDIDLWMAPIFLVEFLEFFSMTLHLLDGFFQLTFGPFPMPIFLTEKRSIFKTWLVFCWWWFLFRYVLFLLSRLLHLKLLFGSQGLNLMCYILELPSFMWSILLVKSFFRSILFASLCPKVSILNMKKTIANHFQ